MIVIPKRKCVFLVKFIPSSILWHMWPYSFGDKLVKTDTSIALRGAGLDFHLSLRVDRLLEDILRPDRFRVPLQGSWNGEIANKCLQHFDHSAVMENKLTD